MKIRPKLVDSFIMLLLTDFLCLFQIISKYFINPFFMVIVVILLSSIIDFFINRFVLEKYESENNNNFIGYILSIIAFIICVPLFVCAYGEYLK